MVEIPQVRRRLILLGGHQVTVRAREIVFCANENLRVVLGAADFGPLRPWIGVANVFLVDDPRSRQGIVDYRHFVMQDVWIGLVEIDTLLEDGLIVEVQGRPVKS